MQADADPVDDESRLLDALVNARQTLDFATLGKIDDGIYLMVLKAIFAKHLEFNITTLSSKDEFGIYLQPFLRGLVEELIYLAYFSEQDERLCDELLIAMQQLQVFEFCGRQASFFSRNRSLQPIYLPQMHGLDGNRVTDEAKSNLSARWWALGHEAPPTTKELARLAGMDEIYEYLFAGTSRTVHFSPASLLRLGWAQVDGDDPSKARLDKAYEFGLKGFGWYYAKFVKFYGAWILRELVGIVSKQFDHEVMESLSSVLDIYVSPTSTLRWPELITFEEMNIGIEDGIHCFRFINNPFGTALIDGIPAQFRTAQE